MGHPLKKVSISGYKSIKSLKDLYLGPLNIIVGANGAGKSNFVGFFKMLRAMSQEGLASFVIENGGADGFFFDGPKMTPEITSHLMFRQNEYRFSLAPTASSGIMVKKESTRAAGSNDWEIRNGGGRESYLGKWKDRPSGIGIGSDAEMRVYESISSWLVYHFHDTSMTAPMRRYHAIQDWRELNPVASNIGPFLLRLRNKHPDAYEQIRETIQLIAPFFDDFLLEPEEQGNNEVVRLEWRQKGSNYPFQPWQFSDGTIRFICLATAMLQPDPPSTIVVDEPELGLHPFALDALAGLFRETSGRIQLIVSTQSAALLNHFEPAETIVVDREQGASRFRQLDSESLVEWLKDFSLGELWEKNVFDGGPSHE